MCGIVGTIGNPDTTNILLSGLQKLSYRGYDSAGIYVNDQKGHDYLVKKSGKLANLEKYITPEMQGMVGLGHTRWATHGEPSDANAHPFKSYDGRYYMIHNGVIDNYQQLRDKYLQGIPLTSQTDSEIIVQMIAKFAHDDHLTTKDALVKTLKLLDGSYSIIMVDSKDPEKLYVAKNQTPLLIGIANGFTLVSSDVLAMIHYTNKFIEMRDKEIGILTADTQTIEDYDGNVINVKPKTIKLDANAADKGAYPYYMLKEIDEEPVVIRRLLTNYLNQNGEPQFDATLIQRFAQIDHLYIVAAGTSYHAGLVGKAFFEQWANIPTSVLLASEAGYHMPLLSAKPGFLFLSQSGETADSRLVLSEINQQNMLSLTMTNVANSTLAREATFSLDLLAGPEIAVASTKAYTAQIALEAIFAKALGIANNITTAKEFPLKQQLSEVANGMQTLVDQKDKIKQLAHDYFADHQNAFYIGRGQDYYVSLEAALKLKEISYIHAEGFAAGELKHGTIALIEKGTPVVGFVTDPETALPMRSNVEEVIARGAHTLTIAAKSLADDTDAVIIPDVATLLTPLLSVVPAQLLAYYASLERGLNVDQPRNLAKSVTVQ
ncbi:MAG: glutamine--fructose-6-phosphate transaminase (isomerizing) [Candidatus Paralactobacillus gallistercoris]|uniref:Glutamine--fructose-6-phosphate aminotransferase [isomerizing] n=1 Tax=Candidatus Paralactobacillus gallistercoris TaxID=2838724 RepID=A0A948X120_9LACO|nr:glutamine--fructose-6-phosphate transaminase (isomerizing) [Candidatus Paralactobacillus gallistercoris]